jgi:glyoxylase-like metal-dependent hydrolase (beta-lactamase superfamily II)
MTKIITLDLNFQGIHQTIASYLIPHANGAVLIESGPGSTLPQLENCLKENGFIISDITNVLLTHIHLDHAGAAGYLARQGASIYVHEVGAPHMLKPEKLINSATRIYGDLMDQLWGQFLPVPKEKLVVLTGSGEFEIHGFTFKYLDTPGHANHHLVYIFEDTCFCGDVGGVRLPGPSYVRIPTPPPEFHLEKWRKTLKFLKGLNITQIAPTHFGIYNDAAWQLNALEHTLDDLELWINDHLPAYPSKDILRKSFFQWEFNRCKKAGIDQESLHAYGLAMPIDMGMDGILRYWEKFRNA